MPKLTPKEAVDKHATNLTAAIPYMELGIKRVTEAPGKKAAAAQAKMKANIVKALDSGKWAKRVGDVTLDEWQDKMINKGLARIAGGVEAAKPKTEAFYTSFFPFLDKVAAEVNKMPDVTIQDSIARMTKQILEVHKYKR